MTGLIGPLLSLATEGLRFANIKAARKYLDELVTLQKEIEAEEAKGFYSDDQRLVVLYRRLKIVAEAAASELKLNAPRT